MTQTRQCSRKAQLVGCVLCAASLFTSAQAATAQEPPASAESAAAAAPSGDTTISESMAAQPAPAADLASEVTALRSELQALKAKQDEAEAAALLTESAAEPTVEAEPLRVYGFMDFGLDKYFVSPTDNLAVARPTVANTFVFGNLNLYFDATPLEHLRCLAEIRFTLAPHGEETAILGKNYERIDTTAFDFSSPSSQSILRLGGLFIERAWSQYEFSKAFTLQWGLFLNPFGIWNLDHGSPTLISLMLPTFISAQMVPTRLLGLHGYGSVFSGNSEFGYAVHVTNGRSPIDFDFNEDKALGGRAFWAYDGDFGRLVLGASGYWGTYVDQHREVQIMNMSGVVTDVDVVSYTEEVLGFDVALDVGALRVRSEVVLHWINYDAGKVERGLGADGSPQYLPNRTEFSGYVLAAYRTPFRLEPYVELESIIDRVGLLPRWASAAGGFTSPNLASLSPSVGVNVELTTHTQLKTQLVRFKTWDRHFDKSLSDGFALFVRLVDSF